MSVRFIWRPIDRWPRAQTVNRVWSPFRSGGKEVGWTTTQVELEKELRLLGVREAVVQMAYRDWDLRLDGTIRSNAKQPSHPGVVLTFTIPKLGPATYACDRFNTWQANIRGITKGLEALRLLDRYGIVANNEQYLGWLELPSGVPLRERAEPEPLTVEQAGRVVVGWISGAHDLAQNARTAVEDVDYRRYAYRQALKHLHPDAGGDDSDAFLRLQQAIKCLEENDG